MDVLSKAKSHSVILHVLWTVQQVARTTDEISIVGRNTRYFFGVLPQ